MSKTSKKTYHYVITIESYKNGTITRGTYHNVMEWSGTRHEALIDRYGYACGRLGVNPQENSTITIFWSFELNEL